VTKRPTTTINTCFLLEVGSAGQPDKLSLTSMPITDYYVTSDAMGSVTTILDEDGNVLERRSYDAFGDVTCMAPDGTFVAESPTGVDVGFQGQIREDITGLYQMGYRWYNPVLGRWLSRDPIGLDGGYNQNTFCINLPTQRSDANGLVSVEFDFPNPIEAPTILPRSQPLTGRINDESSTRYSDFTFECECKCIDDNKLRVVCRVGFKATVELSIIESETSGTALEEIYGHEQRHIASEWYRWIRRLVQPLQSIKPEFYEEPNACRIAAGSIRKSFNETFERLKHLARSRFAPDHKGELDETPHSPVVRKGYPPVPGSPKLPK
jgi:RHS repeat-associated protein